MFNCDQTHTHLILTSSNAYIHLNKVSESSHNALLYLVFFRQQLYAEQQNEWMMNDEGDWFLSSFNSS